jgi:hypothetical protein
VTQAQALLLSLAVEVPVALVLARRSGAAQVVAVGLAATLLTHPFVWHGTPELARLVGGWWRAVALTELGAVAVEAAVYRVGLGAGWRLAAAIALAANAASFGVGLAVFAALAGPGCPRGTRPDPARAAQVLALAGVDGDLCFGDAPDGGVRDPDGRLLLPAARDDRLLAARVVHLARHAGDPPGGLGCADALAREEAAGWAAELRRRAALGVTDPACPVEAAFGLDPDAEALEEWVRTARDPVAAGLRASHQRRCSE